MQPRKSKPTTPNWAVELREVLTAKTREPKGDGWMTTEEFAESLKIATGTAHKYLRRGLISGHLEKFSGTANSAAGIRIQTWHRPVQRKRK
jgi:hypothetical protein